VLPAAAAAGALNQQQLASMTQMQLMQAGGMPGAQGMMWPQANLAQLMQQQGNNAGNPALAAAQQQQQMVAAAQQQQAGQPPAG
jgi:hypothetical protein